MIRRKVLASIGSAALTTSGCLQMMTESSPGNESKQSTMPSFSATAEPTSYSDSNIGVEVTQSASDSYPAKIKVTYTNDASEERTVKFGSSPPFSEYFSSPSSSDGLILLPDNRENIAAVSDNENSTSKDQGTDDGQPLIPDTATNGCWALQSDIAVFGEMKKVTLGPNEEISEEYTILAPNTDGECFSSGTYRFTENRYFEDSSPLSLEIHIEQT